MKESGSDFESVTMQVAGEYLPQQSRQSFMACHQAADTVTNSQIGKQSTYLT